MRRFSGGLLFAVFVVGCVPADPPPAELAEAETRPHEEPSQTELEAAFPSPAPTDPVEQAGAVVREPLVVRGDVVPAVVSVEGRVEDVEILRGGGPECSERSIRDALSTWRFEPAQLHGEPVAVYYNLNINIRPQ